MSQAIIVKSRGEDQSFLEHQVKPMLENDEVLVQVAYSSLNYKDALALTGKGKILKSFPLNPGIDAAGIIIDSTHPDYNVGTKVIITGQGIGEDRNGGMASYLKVPGEFCTILRDSIELDKMMILGTAGFTAMLALHRMEINGLHTQQGPVLVTGASGGVGQISVALLKASGYEVHALTSKKSNEDQLKELGASEVHFFDSFELSNAPLGKSLYAGVVDNLGGDLLGKLLAHVKLWGNVASIGLATGHEFKGSVMPHILRGVSLLGISSTNCPKMLRERIWQRWYELYPFFPFEKILNAELNLQEVVAAAHEMLENKKLGRTIINIGES